MEDWIIRIAWYAVIGLVAGYLASRLMNQRGNPVYYMLLGVAGALIGGVLWTIL